MKTHIAFALLALHLAVSSAAPENLVEMEKDASQAVSVAGEKRKGDASLLETYQNDQWVRTCVNGACRMMRAGDAKALDYSTISGVFPTTGDASLTKALTPSVGLAMDSVKALDEQKSKLEALQAQMASLSEYFNKGEQTAASAQGQFAEVMSKGASLPAAPPMKAYAAPPSKAAFAAPPSKGRAVSAANAMQMEAVMCPRTTYELGKYQRLYAETNTQLNNANSMNAVLMNEKRQLQNQNAMLEMAKAKAEQQAAFNAKYAAEQKNRADRLEIALAQANAEKAALANDKANLETRLEQTENALADERQTTATLTLALTNCNEEKQQLEQEKTALINELKETQEVLRQTRRSLELEQNAHARTKRDLAATQTELEATEAARQKLEIAKQELEDELSETKNELETVKEERDELQKNYDATTAELAQCSQDRMQCNASLAQEKALTAQLTEQLNTAMSLLEAEKKAREDISALLMSVKAAAEKLQNEMRQLQLENAQLRVQLMKLTKEQEAALAMAAGCPPTYEKFGLSCYKYVREKTQWKMAQEQCMKDGGNLVSIENRQEQAFLVDYLKRHGAESDTYSLTGGNKQMNHWKWLGSSEQYIGQTGPQYWFNEITKSKPGYDCQAMYLRDASQYGKWVALPCYSSAPFTCEYLIAPPGTAAPANVKESMAMTAIYARSPSYLAASGYNKGAFSFAAPSSSKGGLSLAMASKGGY